MRERDFCPEIPFFGADYPDARCVNGYLFDLDSCDVNGNLYVPSEDVPCPFCNTEEFIRSDRFGWIDELGKEAGTEKYREWIKQMKERWGK